MGLGPRAHLLALLLALAACRGRVPDVGAFSPVLEEDGRVVELLREADTLGERDPAAAAQNLRSEALPRAERNWHRAGEITVVHPRAQALHHELVRITGERVSTIDAYATALEHNDVQALHDVIARQIELDRAMDRLEADVQAATREPADRGCAGGSR